MAKRTLTVALHFYDSNGRPEFVDDLFDRLQAYPESRDGVDLFAISWSNLFDEVCELESKIEELKDQL